MNVDQAKYDLYVSTEELKHSAEAFCATAINVAGHSIKVAKNLGICVAAYAERFFYNQIKPGYKALRKGCTNLSKGNSIYVFNKEMDTEKKTDTVIKTVGVAVIAGYFFGTVAMLASGVATFGYLTNRDDDRDNESYLQLSKPSSINLGAVAMRFYHSLQSYGQSKSE